jgi:hypothetical protein
MDVALTARCICGGTMSTRRFIIGLSILMCSVIAFATQKNVVTPDLTKLVSGTGWKIHNRTVTSLNEAGKTGVRFDEQPGDGVAWLAGVKFSEGTIECDLRGKNVLQRSFVGIAFHGVNEKVFDAVYFRPFNFKHEDAVRRSHAVQYISHPAHTWSKLRSEYPLKYEQPVKPVPDPEAWFHARIVVANNKISVFVNDAQEPSLVVEKLNARTEGMVGFWVGTTSGGDFANLKITPSKN